MAAGERETFGAGCHDAFGLPVRSGWWESELHVEALAVLAAWADRYDSDEWDDPPGKLALLYEIERVAGLLRDGHEPFHPDRESGGSGFTF